MSEQQVVEATLDTEGTVPTSEVQADEAVQAASVPQQQAQELPPLKVGFVVGLTVEINYIFQVLGQNPGLVELLGIKGYSDLRIDRLVHSKLGGGDALVLELGQLVTQLHAKVDHLVNELAPPKGENDLTE